MSIVAGARTRRTEVIRPAHPNEFDRRRIERALDCRVRYKYVEPAVFPVPGGYRIESPNCSRNVDPEGGLIDVALLVCESGQGPWKLYSKDHDCGEWTYHSVFSRLHELLAALTSDPHREFWQ